MAVVRVANKYVPVVSKEHQIFTLGGAQKRAATWRMIKCKLPHCPVTRGLCMNGFVYYGAWSNSHAERSLLMVFDVRLEEFTLVELPDGVRINHINSEFVNYQRKVASLVNQSYDGEVDLWVLEDVDKQEWSKIFVVVPSWNDLARQDLFSCRGAISSGEFIFAPLSEPYPFFIISYDCKKDIARRIEIEGIGDRFDCMTVFLDYVECPIFL